MVEPSVEPTGNPFVELMAVRLIKKILEPSAELVIWPLAEPPVEPLAKLLASSLLNPFVR